MSFVEDLLDCIYHQLPNSGLGSDHHYERYEMAWQGGESSSKRVALLRKALSSRLEASHHTFLILDGYDRVSEGLQALLDHEFASLQAHRLRIMITRRVPAFEVPLWMGCDGHDCEESRLKLYWVCKKCYKDQYDCYALCYACKQKGLACPKDGDGYFEELYDHIDIDVSHSHDIEDYIAWDLQKEYSPAWIDSDLGGSPKPQEQQVEGIMDGTDSVTVPSTDTEKLRKAIQFISNIAEGNITITRLYLDNIHKHQTLDDVENVGDRLPRNIIAFFDAGIERIKQQPRAQSDIALMAISAAAEQDSGVPIDSLEDWMRDAITRLPHLVNAPPRNLEDILRPANGFLIEPFSYTRQVSTYNQLFTFYVRENYNDSLFWARSQLNLRRVSRTLTRLEPRQSKLISPPMVASPPSMGGSFDTISDTTINSPRGLTRDYFDRSSSSNGFPFDLKRTFSPRQLSESGDVELGIKKLGMSGRSLTMLPSAMTKREFRKDTAEIPEEPANDERGQPRPSYSINTRLSKVCVFCENIIFNSAKLSGNHQRLYRDLEAPETKECIFCSALYKDFMGLPRVHRRKLHNSKSLVHRWTVRSTAKNSDREGSIAVSFHNSDPQNGSSTRKFYLFPENDFAHIPSKDEIGLTTDPSINGGYQVKKWIDGCDCNHSGCIKAAKNTWVPTRLLDLQTGDSDIIRLVNCSEENIQGPYVTLSHCWGPRTKENEFLTLQGETVEEYKTKGIKLTTLSVNFQQAINVARFIGIRYIWIDSLCIIQGPASDFATEGQLMHKVYRNSYCNLAAADSENSTGGLFRPREPADILPGRYRGDGRSAIFGTTAWAIVPENLWDTDLLGLSIYTRGWVFQGKFLSVSGPSSSSRRFRR